MFFAFETDRLNIVIVCIRNQFAFVIIVTAAFKTTHCLFFSLFLGKSEIDLFKVCFSLCGSKMGHFRPRLFGESCEINGGIITLYKIGFLISYRFATEITVDNNGGFIRLAYCGNGNIRTLVCCVAYGKNTVNRGCKSAFVRRNCVSACCFQFLKAFKIWILTDSHYNGIKGKCFRFSLNRLGTAASAFVRLAETHFLQKSTCQFSVFACELNGICKILIYNALLLGFENFLRVGRHFVLGTAIYYIHIFCAQSYGCTASVHCGVTAAAYGYIFTDIRAETESYFTKQVNSAPNAF